MLSGRLWYEASNIMVSYYAAYVPSAQNLAEGPSRGEFQVMKELQAQEVPNWEFPSFVDGLGGWLTNASHAAQALDV